MIVSSLLSSHHQAGLAAHNSIALTATALPPRICPRHSVYPIPPVRTLTHTITIIQTKVRCATTVAKFSRCVARCVGGKFSVRIITTLRRTVLRNVDDQSENHGGKGYHCD